MKKTVLKNISIFLVCIFVAQALFYYAISDYLSEFIWLSGFIYVGLLLLTAFILYVFVVSLLNKRLNNGHVDMLALLYFIMIIGLSFFKMTVGYRGININPFNIVEDLKTSFHHAAFLLVTNLFIYLPLGVYAKYKLNLSKLKLAAGFIPYIFFIEVTEYVTYRGVFDTMDIITNTVGFFVGICIYELINRKYTTIEEREKLNEF